MLLAKTKTNKKKYARGNQMPFLTKKLFTEIMTRSKLRSNYLKNRNEENKTFHVKQRNCVSLLPKSKKKKDITKTYMKKT